MSTPLTTRALDRLRGIVAGNGIDAGAVTITGTNEAEYTLEGELSFSGRWELELAKQEEQNQYDVKEVPSADTLQSMASGRAFPARWWESALDELKANNVGNGTGWGADGISISLPAFTELFNVREVCRTCAGDKIIDCTTCQGSGLEDCWHCNRSGREPANPQQPCTVCKGEMKAECRTCTGRRKVGCPACKGRGSKQTIYALRFAASTRFALHAGNDLPSALRRSIDRAGAGKLANGHANITQAPMVEDEINPLSPRVHFIATIPFASATFGIAGRHFTAELLGLRTAILEMKPFLDHIAAGALAEAKLHELRLFREAQAIAARRGGVGDFMRGYPVGLSREMAEKIFVIARQSLNDLLARPRRQAAAVGLLGSAVLSALYFFTPLRTVLLGMTGNVPMTDLLFPVLPAIVFVVMLQWWTGRILQQRIGSQAYPGLLNSTALITALLIFVVHIAILLTMPDKPMWFLMERLEWEVWWDNLGRPDPDA